MTVMYSFCVWFPVRLGAVFVSLTCIVESLACLVATVIGLQNKQTTVEKVSDLLANYDLIAATEFFTALKEDPDSYLNGIIIALSIHMISCLLLLLGCFKCKIWLIYPFVGIDFVRITTLTVVLILILIVIKTNTVTLGLVVACSIFGGFFILYLWYQWFCVVSLCQIIREVRVLEKTGAMSTRKVFNSQQFNGKIGFSNNFEPYYAKANNITNKQRDNGYFGLPILN